MADNIPDISRKAARTRGGIPAAPRLETIKTRPDEIVEPAPLHGEVTSFSYEGLRQLSPAEAPALSASARRGLPENSWAPNVFRYDYAERRQWATSIWIPESEEYDAERNVLTLRGYYRVYLFDVWVKQEPGQSAQRDAEERTHSHDE